MTRTLLIIDDNQQVGAFVQRLAEGIGYTACATTTVVDFKEHFSASPPDEIVLDLQLGEHDGIEVLRYLAERGCRARITLVSGTDGRTLDSARQLAEDLGLNVGRALSKPMRGADLRAALAPQEDVPPALTSADLATGIENAELLLEYQPIVDCSTGAMTTMEALVRWARPGAGRVSPDTFIALAEADPDLMDRLTFAVVDCLAADRPIIGAGGFSGRFAVNISAQNLRRLDFPERLDAAIRRAGLLPADLKLEVTETAAMSDPIVQVDVLLRLRLKGFELAIDDFGTGYSCLSMLRRLPYAELKIDRSFVSEMQTSHDCRVIVKAILALAQSMELRTVAEGVEDRATLDALIRLGATSAQGYGIGRPMPAVKLAGWEASRGFEAYPDASSARCGDGPWSVVRPSGDGTGCPSRDWPC